MTGMTGMTGMARDDRDGRDGWGVAVMHMGVAIMLQMTTTLYAWDLNPSHTMSVELSRSKRPQESKRRGMEDTPRCLLSTTGTLL